MTDLSGVSLTSIHHKISHAVHSPLFTVVAHMSHSGVRKCFPLQNSVIHTRRVDTITTKKVALHGDCTVVLQKYTDAMK